MGNSKVLRKQIEKASEKVAPGTLVRFGSRSLTMGGPTYTYAAVFVVDKWWLTGEARYFGAQSFTNEAFVEILSRKTTVSVEVAVEFNRIK